MLSCLAAGGANAALLYLYRLARSKHFCVQTFGCCCLKIKSLMPYPPEEYRIPVQNNDSDPDPDDIDPSRIPEFEGMAEDPPDPVAASHYLSIDDADGPDVSDLVNGIGSHLDELRMRLVISLAAFVPMFILGFVIYQPLWKIIIRPLESTAPHLLRFQALGPSDGLIMAMRIAFAFALFISLPVWMGQIWSFIAPGLTGKEKKLLYLSLGSGTVLFVLGAALAYFIGVPFALEFLLPFNQSLDGWENAFTGTGYVDFVITCCAGFGIAFELPLVMAALAFAGIITASGVRAYWKIAILVVVVAAAIMTPPDPFTQMMLALPMIGLFAIGYFLVTLIAPE